MDRSSPLFFIEGMQGLRCPRLSKVQTPEMFLLNFTLMIRGFVIYDYILRKRLKGKEKEKPFGVL